MERTSSPISIVLRRLNRPLDRISSYRATPRLVDDPDFMNHQFQTATTGDMWTHRLALEIRTSDSVQGKPSSVPMAVPSPPLRRQYIR